MAMHLERKIHIYDSKKYREVIDKMSIQIQQIATLFIDPNDESKEQIQKLFKYNNININFTNHISSGEFNPNNKDKDWFFMFENFVYKDKNNSILATNSRNYLNNTSVFYNLSLILQLFGSNHSIPIEGNDHQGNTRINTKLSDLLTKDIIGRYLKKVNYGIRESANQEQTLFKKYIGPFIKNEYEKLPDTLLVSNQIFEDFQQNHGWEHARTKYSLIPKHEFVIRMADKGLQGFAGMSGTTAGLLCAYIRLEYLCNILENDNANSNIKINKQKLIEDLDLIADTLYTWMVLAGDHHPDEVIFSYHFIKLYCNNYLENNGNLKKANDEEITKLINNILDKKDFYSSLFKNNGPEFYNYLINDVQSFLNSYIK